LSSSPHCTWLSKCCCWNFFSLSIATVICPPKFGTEVIVAAA
jgi:hypothetical protein